MVSIIIVHFNVKKELFNCIESIISTKPKVSYEIIVVDNDEKSGLRNKVKSKFSKVKYIKSPANIGYGAGNNLGAKFANGEYFFFLNPDTIVFPNTVDELVSFMQKEKTTGILSPLLIGTNGEPYQQGAKKLRVLEGIISLSFINKLIPNNPISKRYFLSSWNKKNVKEVDVVPGTALVIRRKLFEEIGGFDERFFLFFEEFDLCNRVKKLGYKIFILPSAKIKHIWGSSTKKSNLDLKKIFKNSRFYYFRKHYGIFSALFVELFASFGKKQLMLASILSVGVFLRLYRLDETMTFIGDVGWFYLSARDMILKGEIPLVGITSSHIWLHQGPFWTYILAVLLWLFNFNPLSGGIFAAIFGIFTILAVYKVGKETFSDKAGLISSLLYSTSPVVVMNERTPYHTSFISFFTVLLFFSICKWIKGRIIFFPFSILLLQILYNFELAAQVLWGIIFVILIFGIWKRKEWTIGLLRTKTILLSILAFLIPMMPVMIYDFSHGFPQTFKFLLWIPYRILKHMNLLVELVPSTHEESFLSTLLFFKEFYQKLIFPSSNLLSLFVFIVCIVVVGVHIYKKRALSISVILLSLFMLIPFVGFLINKTPSEAYLPVLFPTIIIFTGWIINKIIEFRKITIYAVIFLFAMTIFNATFVIINILNDSSYKNRIRAAKEIIKKTEEKNYNLVGKGRGSEFESFTMNYEYLIWWLGHGPSEKNEDLKIYISETSKGIIIEKNEK